MSKGRIFLERQGSFLQVLACFALFPMFVPRTVAEEKIAVKTDGVEIKFSALTQLWFTTGPIGPDRYRSASIANIGVVTFPGDPHTYKVRRAELQLSGKLEKNKIYWAVMLDPGERPSNPLQDAYVELKYIPRVGFKVGQFKVPTSMETLIPSSQLDFVERAKIIRILSDNRDIGAFFFGDYRNWEWQFGEINGSGQNRPDNDEGKEVFGRLVIKPTQGIQLGSSIHFSAWPDFYRNYLLGTEFKMDSRIFGLRAEAIWSHYDRYIDSVINTPPLLVSRIKWGGYTSLLYKPFQKHQVCIRLEWLDKDSDVGRDAIFLGTIGYNFLQTSRVKWQANFIGQAEQRGNRANRNIYFGVVNLQVSF